MCDGIRFSRKNFFARNIGKMDQKWIKNRVFWIYWKNLSLIFTEFILYWKFTLFVVFLHKSHIWENFGSWDMGQNVLSQLDCKIFQSTISPEKINETAWFLACWYKVTYVKSSSKIFWVGMVRNGYGHSGPRILKLTLSQQWINRTNWFFAC